MPSSTTRYEILSLVTIQELVWGNTIIGPVMIGNNVILAQNVVISALNHNFEDVLTTINQQGVKTEQINIENNVWIGANSTILDGVHIGEHVVVGNGVLSQKIFLPLMWLWGISP